MPPSSTSTEPVSTLALNPLNAISTHLETLISSLVHSNTFASAPSAATSLVTADDALTTALNTLKQHQQNYARILNLRDEAKRLEDELKNTIRRAVRLREDAGRVHPSILDDDYDSSDDESDPELENDAFGQTGREVDYHTLLNFAARIGKHNSLAAREAEQEWDRRKIEALKKEPTSPTAAANIAAALAKASAPAVENTASEENGRADDHAEKDILELQALDLEASLAARRAQQGLGYPDGTILRMGQLGRLQKIREDAVQTGAGDISAGEDAVAREVERLVRETESVAPSDRMEGVGEDMEMDDDVDDDNEQERGLEQTKKDNSLKITAATTGPRREASSLNQSQNSSVPLSSAPQKRKKISLDLGADDDEEDDDDDDD